MTDTINNGSVNSFWKASLPEIRKLLVAKWQIILALGIFLTVCHFIINQMMFQEIPAGFITEIKSNPQYYKLHPELMPHSSLGERLLYYVPLILMISLNYFFTVSYLQMAAQLLPPRMTIKGFFFWLWKSIQKYLLWILCLITLIFIIGVMIGVASLVIHRESGVGRVVTAIMGIAGILMFCYSYYFYLRLILVTPLSILDKNPVLRTSRQLTKGHCWRIFVGLFVLFFVIGGPLVIPEITILFLKLTHGLSDLSIDIPLAMLQGIVGTLSVVVLAVYECVVYRILTQENLHPASMPT